MRKKLLIPSIVLIVIVSAGIAVWQAYDLSSDYNYAAAKIDIKNGDVKLINIGTPKISSKDKEIELVAARYGFKNIYIEKFTAQQTEKGIKDYNKLIDTWLALRNGFDWKKSYDREVDSLYRIASPLDNQQK